MSWREWNIIINYAMPLCHYPITPVIQGGRMACLPALPFLPLLLLTFPAMSPTNNTEAPALSPCLVHGYR